jgi:hypothetical protein
VTPQVGWVAGTGVGSILFDEFKQSPTSSTPRLCRGDANNDGFLNVGDRASVASEVLGGFVAPGQPDCNEDSFVNVGDRACITNLILQGVGECNGSW